MYRGLKMNSQSTILIADDVPANIFILKNILSKNTNYKVITASTGKEVLELSKKHDITLFLLDVIMPEMDGFQTAIQIKKDTQYKETPVIFITSAESPQDRIKGFETGAVDYIMKPFESKELLKRVELHLELARRRQESQMYAQQMEDLANQRATQLIQADKLSTIGVLSAGIAHEVNNPMTYISGNIQILEDYWEIVNNILKKHLSSNPSNAKQINFVIEETPQIFNSMKDGVSRVSQIVNSLKSYSRKNEAKRSMHNVNSCIERALILTHNNLKYGIEIDKNLDKDIPKTMIDPQQIEQVLVNLIINASHAMEGISGAKLTLKTKSHNHKVVITIADNGPGIPQDKLEKIWEPFFTTKDQGKGTGLGLYICQNIIEENNGDIDVMNSDTGGAIFTIKFPLTDKNITNN